MKKTVFLMVVLVVLLAYIYIDLSSYEKKLKENNDQLKQRVRVLKTEFESIENKINSLEIVEWSDELEWVKNNQDVVEYHIKKGGEIEKSKSGN